MMKEKEKQLMTEIANFCENECSEHQCCVEENCVLFRLEQIILERDKKNNE